VSYFYTQYVARKFPWSEDIIRTFEELGTEVYNYLWGPNEFTPTGKFLNYSCLDKLEKIDVPVLINIGDYDEILEETAKEFCNKIKNCKLIINNGAAHLTMQDNPIFDIIEINKFLLEK